MTISLRRDLLAQTLFEVLRDASGPVAPKDAIAAVEQRLTLNEHELSLNNSGYRRFETYVRWASSWAGAVGWMSKRGGWTITEAGVEALDRYDMLGLALHRLYLERRRKPAAAGAPAKGYTDPRWTQVTEAVGMVEPGWWTTYGDLAELTGLSAQSIGGFLANVAVPTAYRVLRNDGRVAAGFAWADPTRTDDPRALLEQEGVIFDGPGRADATQRMTAEALREALGDTAAEASPSRRAWLVRGSSVDGRDLVPVWLQLGSVSLAAANLRAVTAPIDVRALQAAVDEDYAHKSYAARGTKVGEFDAFLNQMRPGDHVLTTSQGKVYLGEITGDVEYTASGDNRSNLRRPVRWHNPTRGVVYAKLPAPLPARFAGQADVVNLTDDIAAVESLLAALGVTGPTDGAQREVTFPEVTNELADDLFVDRGWLQEQADLLRERQQLVLYGPPGTGKTYLARALAAHLVRDPGAVKLVQFHPSYTYEDFFEGFRPSPRVDGQLAFTLHPGPFRRLVEAARAHPSDPYVLIIDEINRANLAAVFGELYFLLEYRDQQIELLYSDADFTLPPNVFMIGTMNTADRSIALLDTAMRRRFAFVELHPSQPPIAGLLRAWLAREQKSEENTGAALTENLDAPALLDALNARIAERDLAIGPSYLMRPSIYRKAEALDRVWATSILPLLAEHHYGSGPEALDPYRLDALRNGLGGDPAP